VDIRLVRKLRRMVTLEELKRHSGPGGALESLQLFEFDRLSVSHVSQAHWDFILSLAEAPAPK
jgi:predicted RNA-binding protein with PUA-like domain